MKPGLVTAALLVGACIVPSHGDAAGPSTKTPPVRMLPPVGDYPDAECNYDSSGDFYYAPDGSFWECICERRTFIEDDCGWYNQGPITSARNAQRRKKALVRMHVTSVNKIPRMVVIRL